MVERSENQVPREVRQMPMDEEKKVIKGKIEAILFVAGEAVPLQELSRALQVEKQELELLIQEMSSDYDFNFRGLMINRFADKVQLTTRPQYAEDIVRLLQPIRKQSLSQTIMETLSVIAYRQPVTRAEIEAIRGVKCDYSLQSLIAKGLIRDVGRKDTIGRPILYGTTDEFLSHFGIRDLSELPDVVQEEQE